jgi:hypothetical protein
MPIDGILSLSRIPQCRIPSRKDSSRLTRNSNLLKAGTNAKAAKGSECMVLRRLNRIEGEANARALWSYRVRSVWWDVLDNRAPLG